jgi:arabinofuranosyltransferase
MQKVMSRARAFTAGLAFVVVAQAFLIVTGPGDPFVDDAWISLRYARNLVEGHGLVFNPGERVEGYTHPLWVLLDTLIVALQLSPRLVLSLLGVACWIAAASATRRAARDSGASAEAQMFAGAIVAFAAMGVFWGLSGLETAAFAWALVEAVRLTRSAVRGQSPGIAAGMVFGLACLLRPEGALALLIVIVVTIGAAAREGTGRPALRVAGRVLAGSVITYAPWQLFRVVYYGALLPNTFFAKSGGDPRWLLERGATYLFETAAKGPLVPLALALAVAPRAFRRWETLAPAAVAFALIGFTLWVGGDYLPFGRFVVPTLPLLALAVAGTIDELLARSSIVAARSIGVGACLAGLLGHFGDTRVRAFDNATERYRVAGTWLRERAASDALIATPAAGVIGWIGKTRVLDEFGLTDAYLARHLDPHLDPAKLHAPAGHERGNASYVLERSPDIMFLANVWVRPVPLTPKTLRGNLAITSITDRLLLEDPRFFERYEVLNFRLDETTWLGAAIRKDSALHPSHASYTGPLPASVDPAPSNLHIPGAPKTTRPGP